MHADNLNYAGVAVGIVLVGALLSFFFPGIGAYKWYRGERHTIDDFSVSKLHGRHATGLGHASVFLQCALLCPVEAPLPEDGGADIYCLMRTLIYCIM